ncbi:Deoxyribose-phosphate aldolase [Allomuricauda ruestringensis DSM 13258]|uniref:Deoxyribose-phosphate aldolase n=1 Tax=Allomuricauda ruestringensis (strain DSM 13258 / CIP 107369 / LMG 19739 / B1) TaxID=886377 RepID=G2PMV9_ALLRU|nr:deoxyribose-phosphate aldolase [Allomuricauda ruestringensis]AEM71271.1 Deoxyribose-phosphate aldolase [Allomuricauda ruestringensis DSM 13258]
MSLEKYIDHTNLKPTATQTDITKLCKEAIEHGFYAVCVNGCHVPMVKEVLKGSNVKIAAVIGFPLGAMSTKAKVFEAMDCVKNGSDEIDMVINIGWLKLKEVDAVRDEIKAIKQTIGSNILKVIIETCYLTDEEKELACTLAIDAKADFVKTSTGFGTGGATLKDVALMKKVVGNKAKIKASGGIKTKEAALQYIDLGVSRIGTSSGPSLIE